MGVTRYTEETREALLKYVAMKADRHIHIEYASNAQVHRATVVKRKQSGTYLRPAVFRHMVTTEATLR